MQAPLKLTCRAVHVHLPVRLLGLCTGTPACVSDLWSSSRLGGPGAVDRKCGLDAGGPRPVFHAAEDPWRPDPELHHLAALPLYLRKQTHGHHREGELSFVYG